MTNRARVIGLRIVQISMFNIALILIALILSLFAGDDWLGRFHLNLVVAGSAGLLFLILTLFLDADTFSVFVWLLQILFLGYPKIIPPSDRVIAFLGIKEGIYISWFFFVFVVFVWIVVYLGLFGIENVRSRAENLRIRFWNQLFPGLPTEE